MTYVFAVLCIALMILSLMLLFLGLPGTWAIVGLAGLWAFFAGGAAFGWQFFALIVGLSVAGEIVEFLAGHFGAKKYGGSNRGSIGGMIGAILGGILCAPIAFGFGALPGALAGAFAGCFAVEALGGKKGKEAARAAWGTTLGRFGGFVVKLGIGISIIWLSVPRIWPV